MLGRWNFYNFHDFYDFLDKNATFHRNFRVIFSAWIQWSKFYDITYLHYHRYTWSRAGKVCRTGNFSGRRLRLVCENNVTEPIGCRACKMRKEMQRDESRTGSFCLACIDWLAREKVYPWYSCITQHDTFIYYRAIKVFMDSSLCSPQEGRTPLQLAVEMGHVKCAELLLRLSQPSRSQVRT